MTITPFKYAPHVPNANTLTLDNAEVITGFDSFMWVERYRKPGEFEIKAPVSSRLRQTLPLGTFISHLGTQELMFVETHEIDDTQRGDAQIKITGRSFEAFMEHRIISYSGLDLEFPPPPNQAIKTFYFTGSAYAHQHAVELIEWHMYQPPPWNTGARLDNIRAVTAVPAATGTSTTREMKITDLHKGVMELLSIDDLGIRSVRPGPSSGLPLATDVGFVIHQGQDLTESISFSYDNGDIETGQYLWTNKTKKTSALAQSNLYRQFAYSDLSAAGYDLRAGYVDATDIDLNPANMTREQAELVARASSYLGDTNSSSEIVRIELSDKAKRYEYRSDYNVGDIISVFGNYGTSGPMRVVEHVEIIDKTGTSSYPTLETM